MGVVGDGREAGGQMVWGDREEESPTTGTGVGTGVSKGASVD